LGYQAVAVDAKLEALKQFWGRAAPVTEIAKKLGVSRDSIYTWAHEAEELVREHFGRARPGPRGSRADAVARLQEENARLRDAISVLSEQVAALSRVSRLTVDVSRQPGLVRPAACPHCGAEKVWRNGRYSTREGPVQRFLCRECRRSVFVVKRGP